MKWVTTAIALGSSVWIVSPILTLTACATQADDPPQPKTASVQKRAVTIRADGALQKNGHPFFPVGFYHVSWKVSPTKQIKHLEEIAAAGFNLIHASATDFKSYATFLHRAKSLGVSVITEHHFDPITFTKYFKNEPAILAWNIADDVDGGRWTPAQVFQLHHQLRNVDPNHPTYISGYSTRLQTFVQYANVIGRQSYPIRFHTGAELARTLPEIAEISSALPDRPPRALLANLQLFAWSAVPGQQGTAPDALEVRNMTYQALLGGAKGLLYYTYYDSAWYLPDRPKLWDGLKSLNRQIKGLSPWLLNGRFQRLKFADERLKGGIWSLNGRHLTVILNTSQHQGLPAKFLTPFPKAKTIKSLFQTKLPLQRSGETLHLIIPPKMVQVYEMS
ncbi:MAG: hypothetical protein WCD18_01175 [Thermosynechococcaceae cyanobacterium]